MHAFSAVFCIKKCTLTDACALMLRRMHAYNIFAQCYSSLPYLFLHCSLFFFFFPLSVVYTHIHSQTLSHALLSSKESVAYKLAAVSSQSLALYVGRGRQDKLLRLDGTELNQAMLDWVILGWGFLLVNNTVFLLGFARQGWTILVLNRLN